MKTLTQCNTSQVYPQGTEACEQDYKLTLNYSSQAHCYASIVQLCKIDISEQILS